MIKDDLVNFDEKEIEKYKEQIVNDFMSKSVEQIKKEFNTDRICWAFVMWTYRSLGIFIEGDERLKDLVKSFSRVKEDSLPYKFPDIIIFRQGTLLLQRHAGIMLDRKKFVHLGRDCNGLQFTDITRLPWSHLDRMVIRHNEICNT